MTIIIMTTILGSAFKSNNRVQSFLLRHPSRRIASSTTVFFSTKASAAASTVAESSSALRESLPISQAPVITLRRSRQSKAFRNGNQLVFTKAIQSGSAEPCALVQVVVAEEGGNNNSKINNKKGQSNNNTPSPPQQQQIQPQYHPIGWGVYNPNSLYKIRILCHRYLQPSLYSVITPSKKAKEEEHMTVESAMQAMLKHHFTMAVKKRQALGLKMNEANSDSNMFRLVNGEGDGLSGLQVDVIASHIVIQSSAAWCEMHKDLIMSTVEQVTNCNPENIVWKVAQNRLKQDGYYDQDITSNNNDEDGDDDVIVVDKNTEEAAAEPVLALENGVAFQTFPALEGQKTGVYCDQRENRRTLSQYTQDKTVLDLCCYHGGFSLTALVKGGAAKAVGVDSSAAAIECAQANAVLNNVQDDKMTFLQSDITEYMQQAATDGVSFDVVVLDPPKLAPTAASLDKARRKYHGLNRDAIKLVNPAEGGILMTCTCSAAMTQAEGGQYFLNMVAGAALAAGREVTLLSKAGAASCHTQSPVSWPAGAYLTAAIFYVHPI